MHSRVHTAVCSATCHYVYVYARTSTCTHTNLVHVPSRWHVVVASMTTRLFCQRQCRRRCRRRRSCVRNLELGRIHKFAIAGGDLHDYHSLDLSGASRLLSDAHTERPSLYHVLFCFVSRMQSMHLCTSLGCVQRHAPHPRGNAARCHYRVLEGAGNRRRSQD